MQIPDCEYCGGILKPDAVFYGDSVPKQRLVDAGREMENAEGLVVIGSSLTTYSGYRFCLWAQRQQKPIVIINQGSTRADSIATGRTDEDCSLVLKTWFQQVN